MVSEEEGVTRVCHCYKHLECVCVRSDGRDARE
jgi:hypothetical protein